MPTQDWVNRMTADSGSMLPDAFGRYVREEIAKWAKVVKESGATVD